MGTELVNLTKLVPFFLVIFQAKLVKIITEKRESILKLISRD